LKKIRSLNLNTKIILVGMLLPLGFLGSFLLNNFLKETYSSRKLELEKSIENLLDKNVDLGDYLGIRFLGISLGNSKISSMLVEANAILKWGPKAVKSIISFIVILAIVSL